MPTSDSEPSRLRPLPTAPYDGVPPPMTGEARSRRERRLACAAVEVVEVDEEGQPAIDLAGFSRLDAALQIGLLSRLVQRVGGRDHPPRRDRLRRAVDRIAAAADRRQSERGQSHRGQPDRGESGRGQDFTLSRCRLMLRQAPASRRLHWLVRAENGGIAAQPLVPAAFFACGAGPTAHLDYRLLTTECAREPVQS